MDDAVLSYVPAGDWAAIDAALVRLGRSKAEHDYEEGRWLLAARRGAVHTRLGFATLAEYIERRLGYDGRTTAERLRVASLLADLPLLAEALRTGRLSWTAIRELVRVAVLETEGEWMRSAENKSVREIERMVAGLRPGDSPGTPKDPALRKHVVRLELTPELFARYREAVDRIRKDVDPHLSDEEAVGAMLDRVLGGPEDEGRSPYQVSLTTCAVCARTWERSRGELVEVGAEVGERAQCDAQIIGPAPAPDACTHVGDGPARTTPLDATAVPATPVGHGTDLSTANQTVTPRFRRMITARDKGKCCVPGCRNTRWLELHHVVAQAAGGAHDPEVIALICSTHHRLLHMGRLVIEGRYSTGFRFTHADGTAYGAAPKTPFRADAGREAHLALRSLGIEASRARVLLDAARREVAPDAPTPELVRAALRIDGRTRAARYVGSDVVSEGPALASGRYADALGGMRQMASRSQDGGLARAGHHERGFERAPWYNANAPGRGADARGLAAA
jgi:hypothetical protein